MLETRKYGTCLLLATRLRIASSLARAALRSALPLAIAAGMLTSDRAPAEEITVLTPVPAFSPSSSGPSSGGLSSASPPAAQAELRGWGPGYWGVIPSPADSVRAVFDERPAPLWERTLQAPHTLIILPLGLVTKGLKTSVIFMDEHGAISKIKWLVGPQAGPFGLKLRFEAGELLRLGVGLVGRHDAFFGERNALVFRWSSALTGTHRFYAAAQLDAQAPVSLILGAGYSLRPNARFFGLGPRSREEDESFYTQELAWGGAAAQLRLVAAAHAELSVLYSEVSARGPGGDNDPAVDERFMETPRGYKERSKGTTIGLALIRETTAEEGRPAKGGLQRLALARHIARKQAVPADGVESPETDYTSFRAELEQFLPLWNAKQTLALRAFADWIDAERPQDLPFQRLPSNDEPFLLRGFRDYRWRGRGIAAVSCEYRWPIWAYSHPDALGVDAYLFTDIGQVFDRFEDIAGAQLTHSYGFGLRLVGNGGFGGRAELGAGEEGIVIRMRMEQLFQYAKGGIMHGKDQIALR